MSKIVSMSARESHLEGAIVSVGTGMIGREPHDTAG